ncbi:putative DNA glycosylase, helix-turn-helix, base-excision DNA repair, demeter [Rosa chinensis]|uniref:Putative DNA glycosylase, helix-turn-helix, base-excision DNA repair, demeter n=1 Tax=Rosa chinensis TaxID=74649 RepID=A0A2P6RBI1_ROSCH|nr:DNA glycosylase/AP lyase ROS1 [Rosa chinensis]PRQ43782.1 putative DNA glycosylase, helix-turn-helix, base-excision DNA repair, demeter [Rosa chinensis]
MDMNEQRKDAFQDWASCIAPTTPYRPILPKPPQEHKHHEFFMPPNKFPFALPANEGNNGAGPVGAGNTLEMSREVPCIDLLALAHAASSAADNNAVMHGEPQYDVPFPHHLPYDLNSLPETTYGQFAPITPEKASSNADHRKDQQIEEQMNAGATTFEIFELGNNKDVANPATDSSHATFSTQVQENQTQLQDNHIIKEGNDSIDLNKTPQLKQRRRKHRPKVIREGKPKPLPKPPTTKETPARRKYVRKNALDKNATPPPPKELGECTDSNNLKSTKRSCRRVLNYDMEEPGDDISSCRSFNSGSDSQMRNFCTNGVASKSTVQLRNGINSMVDNTRMELAHELVLSTNQWLKEHLSLPEQQSPATPCPARNSSVQPREYVDCQQDTAEGKARVSAQICHKNAVQTMLDGDTRSSSPRPNDSNCSSSMILTQENELKGSKRKYYNAVQQTDPSTRNLLGVHYNNMPAYDNMMSYMHFPYIYKKKRTDKAYTSIISSTSCRVTMAENVWRQSKLQAVESILPSYQTQSSKKRRSKAPTRVRDLASLIRTPEHILHQSTCLTKPPADGNGQRPMNCNSTQTCMDALVTDVGATLAKKKRTKRSSVTSSHRSIVLYKNQPFVPGSSGVPPEVACTQILSVDAITDQLKCLNLNRENSKFAYQGYNVVYNTQKQENNALVLYRRDGTVVPFEGAFDPIKKRRPRPKVDLDEETDKVWKLLMDNINSEGVDGTDEQKAKWWEEERRVFQGRADSFIARMHLVQGDRRFSPWKGSVVDSVVGVFLTQNVSDHLSSSAFMSLAARFPLKSVSNQNASDEKVAGLAVDEPEVCISEISNQPLCDSSSVTFHDTEHSEEKVVNSNENTETTSEGVISTNEPDCKLSHSLANRSTTINPRTASECCIEEDLRTGYDIVSSQNSVDSSTSHTVEKTGSCESNSETEETPNTCQNGSLDHSTSFLQKAEVYSLKTSHMSSHDNLNCELYEPICMQHDDQRRYIDRGGASQDPSNNFCLHITSNPEVVQVECSELFEEVIQSSNISKNKYEDSLGEQSVLTAESASQDTISNKLTVNDQDAQRCFNESCNCIEGKNNLVQSQFRVGGNPNKVDVPAEEHKNKIQQNCNISRETTDIMHKGPESDLSFNEVSKVDAATSKTKNRRPGKEKKQQDWDKLRERAEPNGRKREKTANTMDSVDWEAVRTANVNDIAQTIKERGMNNMLAERIKEFLNRLVREHGSVDLEWLRDVPPDQAKEYLLSFRGLGLKSVECVRLLTLHHLAFPVDTNVGRIAVRLGWVPLQPLPESLQLHLLELYPVLESIQKYLWPRLCKLDQRTLYELHYQMITFGKVFCTKSKPNCNACPMRGECRHFASAFASARLALPGPEEKSLVSATEDRNTYQNPGEINNGMPLPLPLPHPHRTEQLEANQQLAASQQSEPKSTLGYCEPIIEEPATPEPECTQIVEDIEDFYEDPDEIPTIKLNMEQFTQNLQNYMQQNMELQQGEMSKALVALTPDAASLPTPKLKNVSRLRTEHQVYELPDSHPLLDRLGLDKREPDDPCNYLLAIWTPGETANSIQPPENRCSSQEFGKLCDDKECFQCNSAREAYSQTVRGTLLIPCRTAMRGSFPLNGTYFQVNEVFADHDSSLEPLDVPRGWLWNLNRRTVYFGTSIPTIFKGLTTPEIQHCFWRGFVCVRGFDQKSRGPRPLMARLHFPASRLAKPKDKKEE